MFYLLLYVVLYLTVDCVQCVVVCCALPDGVFGCIYKVTVHQPISSNDGDLTLALYGSFLPVPDQQVFLDKQVSCLLLKKCSYFIIKNYIVII